LRSAFAPSIIVSEKKRGGKGLSQGTIDCDLVQQEFPSMNLLPAVLAVVCWQAVIPPATFHLTAKAFDASGRPVDVALSLVEITGPFTEAWKMVPAQAGELSVVPLGPAVGSHNSIEARADPVAEGR
jgi:hypothetical protein